MKSLESEVIQLRGLLAKKEKYHKVVHQELVEVAKRLRSGDNTWKPNTQTESIFAKEVISKVNLELTRLIQISEDRKHFKTDPYLKSGKDNSNFRKAMSLLTLCFGNIDEINDVFDDFVTELDQARSAEFQSTVRSFVEFFDKIESIRTSPDAKELIKAFHL